MSSVFDIGEESLLATYIFLPIPTQDLLRYAEKWNKGRIDKGKQPYHLLFHHGINKNVRRALGMGVLQRVASGDKLYVLAHGHANRKVICAEEGGRQFDPGQFAAYLEKEGLRKDFRDLRIFACETSERPGTGEQSFAEELLTSMRKADYLHVTVSGYSGITDTNYDFLFSKTSKKDGLHYRAKDNRTTFPREAVAIEDI
jgi:hypothetical protein